MMEQRTSRIYVLVVLMTAMSVCVPTHAGVLRELLSQTGILDIVTPVTTAVGIELDDTVTSLDGAVSGVLGGDMSGADTMGAELNLTSEQSSDLLSMDTPVTAALGTILSSVFAPAPAFDQPALIPLVNLDPVFDVGQIQTQTYQCSDGDGDGVCDQDDQCLKTPVGIKVLANGCYLDGPRGVALEGVFFANDSDQLTIPAQQILRKVAEVIKQSSATLIEVGGYTDNAGDAEYNLRLSAARAATVREYLIAQGIQQARLQTKGYGESSPRADNTSDKGRALNRRVELKIVKSAQ
ncbi:OmpA family protein [uncultured Zhongshania sp.]|uniref:OmpA family protein n=1 Tax=uncultured Zhongshania sp. TaxID=1642288 RepID=UPI0025DE4626|nr:OmpA family protein [uncultured Zhongshania sp.]